ncbi:MAG TPA: carbamoyltransferase HypF [Thermodesulfovibrionales bacterium]|nr:carbamoyltransferase HypF [Thermodesulfovibrionales bacterium]
MQIKVLSAKFKVAEKENPIAAAIRLLKEGAVIAVKGLGGFHIACDARNEEAVNHLRERKRRSNKPFALMAPDIEAVEKFCTVSGEEEALLISSRRPVVLVKKREGKEVSLPEAVSPRNRYLGFMLPYTPLHYLLFYYPFSSHASRFPSRSHFDALVMTSGNLSEEPIVVENADAAEKLSGLVDALVLHNRSIFMRVDDSVLRVAGNKTQTLNGDKGYELRSHDFRQDVSAVTSRPALSFIRRSRGYAPEPIALHDDGPDVLGCGADLKNTFTVTKGRFAVPSQHIGDMENYETLKFFEESLENLKSVYRVEPVAIAHDMHPGYLSTQWALKEGAKGKGKGVKVQGIQHHYAHIGSVMAEHGLSGKVIGVSFDGTGYGTDGNLWGGEFLVADIKSFERVGHFRYIPLPGGEAAIKEPWRSAVSYMADATGDEAFSYLKSLGFVERYGADLIDRILRLANIREFSPLSSGAGRLFDAVSALLGLCDRNTFEGEAAIALESLVMDGIEEEYPFEIIRGVSEKGISIDFSHAILRMCEDLFHSADRRIISTRFHNTVSSVIIRMAEALSETFALESIILSGGTFQNVYLLERAANGLHMAGMKVFVNEQVPCNDAGISLGQAYLCRERLKMER